MADFAQISKLDAVKRQLEMAIRLFFNYGDVVAIHTLSDAALTILSDLGNKQGIRSFKKELFEIIKPEKKD